MEIHCSTWASQKCRRRRIFTTRPPLMRLAPTVSRILAQGTYAVRQIVPAVLSATPATEREHVVTIAAAENRPGVNFADVYRPNEIHGTQFDDANGNHLRDLGEAGTGGVTIFVDLDRDNSLDAGEPTTVTLADGSYSFTNLSPGAYVIREVVSAGYTQTSPTTVGGILWPTGVSNPAVGNVSPLDITTSLAIGRIASPNGQSHAAHDGALTNLVDVFLLFDDTGSFVNNSPIVRAAFPDIIAQLQASLPGIDLGFGVGRLEEYGNFASEYSTGRPFVSESADRGRQHLGLYDRDSGGAQSHHARLRWRSARDRHRGPVPTRHRTWASTATTTAPCSGQRGGGAGVDATQSRRQR